MDTKENKQVFWTSFFDKKTESGATSKARVNANELLAQELHKPRIEKFKKGKSIWGLKIKLWTADLAQMGSISSFNHSVKYLLCVVDGFTKYAWI